MGDSGLAAYVLHHHDWSESSQILDTFTRARGRIIIVAKGAKRPGSQLRSVLLPFQRLNLVLVRGRRAEVREVETLRSADWAGGPVLPGRHLLSAYYLNELLTRLVPLHEPAPALFDAYAATLASLCALAPDAAAGPALRAFEITTLDALGWLPQLDQDTARQAPLGDSTAWHLHPQLGLTPATDPALGLPAALWQALQRARGHLPHLQAVCGAAGPGLRQQLQGVLQYHLGHALRSRQVMQGVHAAISAATPSP